MKKQDNVFVKHLKNKIKLLLINEKAMPALVYFLWIGYRHFFMTNECSDIKTALIAFAIALLLVSDYNILYFFGLSTLQQWNYLSIILMTIILLSCNQKWKVLLFAHSFLVELSIDQTIFYLAMLTSSSFICYQIYMSLIFKTISQNVSYFIGFFIIFGYSISRIMINLYQNHRVNAYIDFGLFILFGYMGFFIISYKLNLLKNIDANTIRNSVIMVRYIQMTEMQMLNKTINQSKIVSHKQKCCQLLCFCKQNNGQRMNSYFYLRYLYQLGLRTFNSIDNLFIESYIDFLNRNGQMIVSLHFLQGWAPNCYFQMISRIKCLGKIENILENNANNLRYSKQYQYALFYDSHCQHLKFALNQIVDLKIVFWKQINQEFPKLKKIQQSTTKINNKMSKVNIFYNNIFRKYENKIFCCQGTLLYASFLKLTTNFTEYSDKVIKNVEKYFKKSYHYINQKAFQTYIVRAVMRNQNNCPQIQNDQLFFQNKLDQQNLIKNQNTTEKLIIDKISYGLCQLFGKTKHQLIGCQLKQLIPNQYKEAHKTRLLSLFNMKTQIAQKIRTSQILHQQLILPMKKSKKQLFMAQICVKLQPDIQQGISFISVVKLVKQTSKTAILDLNGNIYEKEAGFQIEVFQHFEVQKYIKQSIQEWKVNKIIRKTQTFTLAVQGSVYQIKVSSPLISIFLRRQNFENKDFPVHIQIANMTNESDLHVRQKSKKQFKQIIQKRQEITQNQSSLYEDNNGINNKIISILQRYCENNRVSIYSYIIVLFIVILIFCLISVFACFFSYDLSWDNTKIDQNPIIQTVNMLQIAELTVSATFHNEDLKTLNKDQTTKYLNNTKINQYFEANNYDQFLMNKFISFEKNIKQNVIQLLTNPSNLLQNLLIQKWQKKIQYQTYLIGTANPMFKYINMSYIELLLNYVIDLNILQHDKQSKQILLTKTFDQQIVVNQKVIELSQTIDENISNSKSITKIITICMSLIIGITLAPFFIVFRKRDAFHISIYDLVVTISSLLVNQQIHSLRCFKNKLKKQNILQKNQQIQQLSKTQSNSKIEESQKISIIQADNKQDKQIKNISFFQQTSQVKRFRKRAGQLNLQNSEYDTAKHFKCKPFFIYSLILAFLLFLIIGIIIDTNYMNTIILKKDRIIKTLNQIIQSQIMFLLNKDFIRNGFNVTYSIEPPLGFMLTQQISKSQNISFALLFIKSYIQMIPNYSYNQKTDFELVIANCNSTASDLNINSLNKYCEYDYSYTVLLGEYASIYKILTQLRWNNDISFYSYLQNNQLQIYFQTLNQIVQKSFYIQSLTNQISKKRKGMVDIMVQDMIQYSVEYNNFKLNMFMLALVWTILTFLSGVFLITKMKNQYLSEVYMLTFLNSKMISNNKRINSFIQSLFKTISGY